MKFHAKLNRLAAKHNTQRSQMNKSWRELCEEYATFLMAGPLRNWDVWFDYQWGCGDAAFVCRRRNTRKVRTFRLQQNAARCMSDGADLIYHGMYRRGYHPRMKPIGETLASLYRMRIQ